MTDTIRKRIKQIASRFGVVGRGKPTTPTLNLPNDWLAIRIPYQQQELSHTQWKAIRRLRGWRPVVRLDRQKSREELSLEEEIGRWATLGQDQETAIHIRRKAIPVKHPTDDAYGEARNKRAVESINEILAAFPAEQIEIDRIGDFDIDTESRDATSAVSAIERTKTDDQ